MQIVTKELINKIICAITVFLPTSLRSSNINGMLRHEHRPLTFENERLTKHHEPGRKDPIANVFTA